MQWNNWVTQRGAGGREGDRIVNYCLRGSDDKWSFLHLKSGTQHLSHCTTDSMTWKFWSMCCSAVRAEATEQTVSSEPCWAGDGAVTGLLNACVTRRLDWSGGVFQLNITGERAHTLAHTHSLAASLWVRCSPSLSPSLSSSLSVSSLSLSLILSLSQFGLRGLGFSHHKSPPLIHSLH